MKYEARRHREKDLVKKGAEASQCPLCVQCANLLSILSDVGMSV